METLDDLAIIIPTGPSKKIDQQRTLAGVAYARGELQDAFSPVMIISGTDNGKYRGSQVQAMYETLRQEGIADSDIIPEFDSRTTAENMVNCGIILMQEKIDDVSVSTDRTHLPRAEMLLRKCISQGYAPRDLLLHLNPHTRSIDPSQSFLRRHSAYIKDAFRRTLPEPSLEVMARRRR